MTIVLNGLSDDYRYLIVSLETQEMDKIDFDELSTKLFKENKKVNKISNENLYQMAMLAKTIECYYCEQQGHMKKNCPVRKYRQEKEVKDEKDETGSAGPEIDRTELHCLWNQR